MIPPGLYWFWIHEVTPELELTFAWASFPLQVGSDRILLTKRQRGNYGGSYRQLHCLLALAAYPAIGSIPFSLEQAFLRGRCFSFFSPCTDHFGVYSGFCPAFCLQLRAALWEGLLFRVAFLDPDVFPALTRCGSYLPLPQMDLIHELGWGEWQCLGVVMKYLVVPCGTGTSSSLHVFKTKSSPRNPDDANAHVLIPLSIFESGSLPCFPPISDNQCMVLSQVRFPCCISRVTFFHEPPFMSATIPCLVFVAQNTPSIPPYSPVSPLKIPTLKLWYR